MPNRLPPPDQRQAHPVVQYDLEAIVSPLRQPIQSAKSLEMDAVLRINQEHLMIETANAFVSLIGVSLRVLALVPLSVHKRQAPLLRQPIQSARSLEMDVVLLTNQEHLMIGTANAFVSQIGVSMRVLEHVPLTVDQHHAPRRVQHRLQWLHRLHLLCARDVSQIVAVRMAHGMIEAANASAKNTMALMLMESVLSTTLLQRCVLHFQ